MKKLFFAILGLVILSVPFALMGCETVTPAGTAPAYVNTETYNAGINALQAQIATKADAATVVAQTARIDTIASQGAGNTYTKGELYTRAEVDASIAAAVAALKANQTWITGTGTGGTTTTTGGTTTTVGGVSVNLDKNQVISTSTDTGNKDVTVTVTNASGAGKSISLLISLTPLSPSAVDNAKLTLYTVKSTLTGFTTAQVGILQLNPDVATLVAKIYWVAPDFFLDNGATKTIWLNFDVKTVDVVTWTLGVKAL
jgi:hypothetical protein